MSAEAPVNADLFQIAGQLIAPGERRTVQIHVANLYTSTPVTLPVRVLRGKKPGPVMFVSAALHGDEIIGVEIIRRVMLMPALKRLAGTLLAVPVVNTLAFLHHSRYLPDRRDLNRSFPGSESGSLAARLAFLFLKEVVGRSQYGIDLHTGAIHRPNLPQIRADLDNPESLRLARAFGAPLLLNSEPTRGTLREYTTQKGIPVLLYESSEALRYDEVCIRIGVHGVLNVMHELGMLPGAKRKASAHAPILAKSSTWVRSPASGVLRAEAGLGDHIRKGELLGVVGDPLGDVDTAMISTADGIIIGRTNLPLVHEGDALFHIARIDEAGAHTVARRLRSERAARRRRKRRVHHA